MQTHFIDFWSFTQKPKWTFRRRETRRNDARQVTDKRSNNDRGSIPTIPQQLHVYVQFN